MAPIMSKAAFTTAFLLLAAGPSSASARLFRHHAVHDEPKQDLHPTLKPANVFETEGQSHEQYYKEDYPHDVQPKALKSLKFDHAYPELQDEDEFDQDYPKDENGDDGEWQAQMDYDVARDRLYKRRVAANKARNLRDYQERQLEELKHLEKLAEQMAREAEERAQDAKDAVDEAEEELRRLGLGDNSTSGFGHNLHEAIDNVAKAAEHLDDCEELLEKAKDALQKRLEEMSAADKERALKALERSEEALGAHSKKNRTQKELTAAGYIRQRAEEEYQSREREHAEAVTRLTKAMEEREAAERLLLEKEQVLRSYGRKVPERLPRDSHGHAEEEEEAHHQSGVPRAAGVLLALALAAVAPLASLA